MVCNGWDVAGPWTVRVKWDRKTSNEESGRSCSGGQVVTGAGDEAKAAGKGRLPSALFCTRRRVQT